MRKLILLAALAVAGCSGDPGLAPVPAEPSAYRALFGTYSGPGHVAGVLDSTTLYETDTEVAITFGPDQSRPFGLAVDASMPGTHPSCCIEGWEPRVVWIEGAADSFDVQIEVMQRFGIPFVWTGRFVRGAGSGIVRCDGWPYATPQGVVDITIEGTWSAERP